MTIFGMDPQEALDDGRIFWDNDGALLAESGIPSQTRSALIDYVHQVLSAPGPFGAGQIIQIDHQSGFLIGGSDPRKDGLALGW
ncbi:Gamma-glutamyltranspeptidase [Mesorhizobium sp. NFR06]|uniref:gamma-glutamyltransferase n=1 Tax=Mesorhizobium sp. NFR06 TaxID=1566290 RepID=UPI0008F06A49|nr:gamma-glutamyltransferase [Mesorhizobium sp. NFR06]SFQ13543.1 Gamma-glutamyltranspeptidase [Mesorhizobium sp. NFR06]